MPWCYEMIWLQIFVFVKAKESLSFWRCYITKRIIGCTLQNRTSPFLITSIVCGCLFLRSYSRIVLVNIPWATLRFMVSSYKLCARNLTNQNTAKILAFVTKRIVWRHTYLESRSVNFFPWNHFPNNMLVFRQKRSKQRKTATLKLSPQLN